MAISIKVTSNRFGELAAKLRDVGRIVMTTAAAIEADAKQRAPVDTGFLRNSLAHRKTGNAEAVVEAGASYAAFVEMGTSQASARPFLTPAAEAARGPFEDAVKKLLD